VRISTSIRLKGLRKVLYLAKDGFVGRGSAGEQRSFHLDRRIEEKSGIRVYKEGYVTGYTFGVFSSIFRNMAKALSYHLLERLEKTPPEELKLDHLRITVKQLFADDVYRWGIGPSQIFLLSVAQDMRDQLSRETVCGKKCPS
jgi:hypothetical protein